MNANKFIFLALVLSITAGSVFAYKLNVKNGGNKIVRVAPVWPKRAEVYDTLKPGESKEYNSGIKIAIPAIRWQEDTGQSNIPGQICFKMFEAQINLDAGNPLGTFTILNDGSYNYNFNYQGSGSGVAKPFGL